MSGGESENNVEATISPDEFAQWVTPSHAIDILTRGTAMGWNTALNTIRRYLVHGELLARADKIKISSRNENRDFRRGRIPADAWGPDYPSSGSDFWQNGLFDWSDGSGYDDHEYSAFDVRFDPAIINQIAGITVSTKKRSSPTVSVPAEAPAPLPPDPALERNRGGRPAGKDGEPIARLTMRLLALPPEELATYTHEALGAELIQEYKKLGLHPPSLDNATRNAGGILRAVRN